MIKEKIKVIFEELKSVFSNIDEEQVNQLVGGILSAKKIVVCGAGRVGLSTRAFGMRLSHLGLSAFVIGDSNVPSIGKGDLFLVSSGSGETQTIYDLVILAKQNGSRVALVTGNPKSRMGGWADLIVQIRAPSKTKSIEDFQSIQPMTTLNEQALFLFYDALVLILMEKTKITHDKMWVRHSNLE